MVKTKNKTKKVQKTAKKSLPTKNIIIVIGVILVVLGLFLAGYNYNLARKDKLTAQTLGEYKIKIEKVSKAIEQKYSQKPELKEYCYHTAEEFSQGVIFCNQELKFTNKIGTDQELIEQIRNLINIVSSESIPRLVEKTELVFDKNQVLTVSNFFYASNRVFCRSQIDAFGIQSVTTSPGMYELSIYCNGGDFRKPIYPLND